MTDSLEFLAIMLEKDYGFVAHVIKRDNLEKIVGGSDCDDRDGIALYIKKFELIKKDNKFYLKLPIGQTFIEENCNDGVEAVELLVEHFKMHHPNVTIKNLKK